MQLLKCGRQGTVGAVGGLDTFISVGPAVGGHGVESACAINIAECDPDASCGGGLPVIFTCWLYFGGVAGVANASGYSGRGSGGFRAAIGHVACPPGGGEGGLDRADAGVGDADFLVCGDVCVLTGGFGDVFFDTGAVSARDKDVPGVGVRVDWLPVYSVREEPLCIGGVLVSRSRLSFKSLLGVCVCVCLSVSR